MLLLNCQLLRVCDPGQLRNSFVDMLINRNSILATFIEGTVVGEENTFNANECSIITRLGLSCDIENEEHHRKNSPVVDVCKKYVDERD